MFPALSTAKLIALGIAAAAVLSFVLLAFHWKHQAADRGEKLTIICKATREASDNPKLGCGNVALQIGELGASVKNTKAALERQNAAVNALAAKSASDQAAAAQASRNAQARARGPEATSERLVASAKTSTTKPCEPSRELQRSWR